jgi:hypothetical protein
MWGNLFFSYINLIVTGMKRIALFFICVFFLSLSASVNMSCSKLICNGKGTLKLTNKSTNTVQKIMINGVNYGTIDPGESKSVELVPGSYTFQQVGISGGTGCSQATVNIVECKTQGFSCSSK